MRELGVSEVENVNGGVVPLVAAAFTVGKALGAGFGVGVAAGTIAYLFKIA